MILECIVLGIILVLFSFWIYYSIKRCDNIVELIITDYNLEIKIRKVLKNKINEYYLETTFDNREKLYNIQYFESDFDCYCYVLLDVDRSKNTHVPLIVIKNEKYFQNTCRNEIFVLHL